MALTRLNEYNTGTTLTEAALEGEFDNIYSNALTLISPLTANLAAGGFIITGLGLGTAASPTLQFTGDTNTGVYSSGADALDLVGGGLRLMTLTSTPSAGIVSVDPGAISATANTNVGRVFVGGTSALTIPAGTTAIVAGLWIAEPNLTATGTITRATTAYIAGAPTEGGTQNLAAWVDAGNVRLDGNLLFDASASPEISVGSTALLFTTSSGGTERMRLTNGGILALGTTVVTSAAAGDLVLPNVTGIRSVNAAGNDTLRILYMDSSNRTTLDAQSAVLSFGSNLSQTTIGANGAASALTANPVGYLRVFLAGSERIIPYYNP